HVDYVLSHELNPVRLGKTTPHRLSILLNSVDDGATHGFHFYGSDGVGDFKRDDVRFQEAALQNFIDDARGTFNLASWGTTDAWQVGHNPNQSYRYADGRRDLDRLQGDLVNFARWGWTFYSALIDRLTGGVNQSDELARLMAKPGLIQIALKASATYILPVALIYDYPLDTQLHSSLCDRFLTALNVGEDLQTVPCFAGLCPNRGKLDVVCPSGFWGYRHEIGMPISLSPNPGANDAVSVIEYQPPLNLSASVATDLALLTEHEKSLRALVPGLACNIAQSRDAVLAQLKRSEADVVYFYCHGGVSRSVPFLQVGPADNPGIIDASNLRAYKIRWSPLRPLVFINGCHTTAVAPDQAINFVSAFLEYSNAAGVIGTEITIFEPLARQFAEEYLRRFFAGAHLGEAIRGARLALLASGNPLGLVYLPFAMADLRLAAKDS
ncbi:MAG TPA: CHAT domain-containing protein, partial [Chloroflexota bacterium]|nr:CHAT domain-containing protein [Chloroflexota bacterium]